MLPSTAIVTTQPAEEATEELMEVIPTLFPPKVVVREPTLEELPALLASMGMAASYTKTFITVLCCTDRSRPLPRHGSSRECVV